VTTGHSTAVPPGPTVRGALGALLRASHFGPTAAVTVLTALLAVALGHGPAGAALVTAAVFCGQLTIGWSNDLVDVARDRAVGRRDKPVARGEVPESFVRTAISLAGGACVVLSLACGWRCALVHLVLGVGSGWAYNLAFKRTIWSAVPYAVAFGALPAIVALALPKPEWPPVWMLLAGALLGVGAHLLNALPDLEDDIATGVKGLPQRMGAGRVRLAAPAVLLAGSVVTAVGPVGPAPARAWLLLATCVALGLVGIGGRGRVPFVTAVVIALLNVVALLAR
jgi:4-hydroxybenzoate polyprenyltransferase